MWLKEVKSLAIPEIKVIKFERYQDQRGYFTEPFRKSQIINHPSLQEFKNKEIVQISESFSKPGTLRGLHFQWNPYMGKLVRTIQGRMIDIIVDLRKRSPTYGKGILYDMPEQKEIDEWIWVPEGLEHGNMFTEETKIEYLCTGEYNGACEAGISPLAGDIDWSLNNKKLLKELKEHMQSDNVIITDKDKNAMTVKEWLEDPRSKEMTYQEQ